VTRKPIPQENPSDKAALRATHFATDFTTNFRLTFEEQLLILITENGVAL
jgi:hypothetical protein